MQPTIYFHRARHKLSPANFTIRCSQMSIYNNSQELPTAPLTSNTSSGTRLFAEDERSFPIYHKLIKTLRYKLPLGSPILLLNFLKNQENYLPLYIQAKLNPTTVSSPRLLPFDKTLPTFAFSTRLFMKQPLRQRHVNCGISAQRNES